MTNRLTLKKLADFFDWDTKTNIFFYIFIIFCGFLWGLGQYPPFCFIRFFGLVPFIFIVFYRKHYLREVFLFGTIAYIINFYWLFITFYESGKMPIIISLLIPVVLAAYYGLQYPIIAIIYKKFYQFNKKIFFYSLPFIFVFIDSLYFKVFKHSIADSLIGFRPFVQLIDITGMTGIILIIMLCNLGIFNLLKTFMKDKPLNYKYFLFIIPFIVAIIYGYCRIGQLNHYMKTSDTIVGAMIQGNITGKQKLDENYFNTNVERYNSLTKEAAETGEAPDIIIWPESIFNRSYRGNPDFLERVIYENYPPLILGISVWTSGNATNSALLIKDKAKIMQYNKEVLLMFGEYVPMEKAFPFFRKLTPLSRNAKHGSTPSIFTINNIKASINICFEEIFPNIVRKKCNEGSNILINLTNDSWFGLGAGPMHHSILGRLRAIENRRAFFRCTATGFTTASDLTGKVIACGKMGSAEVVKARLPLYAKKSIYGYIGETVTYICDIIVICLALFIIRQYFLKPKNNEKSKNHN